MLFDNTSWESGTLLRVAAVVDDDDPGIGILWAEIRGELLDC